MPGIAHHACCCGDTDFCLECLEDPDSLVITVTGSCPDDSACKSAAGVAPFITFDFQSPYWFCLREWSSYIEEEELEWIFQLSAHRPGHYTPGESPWYFIAGSAPGDFDYGDYFEGTPATEDIWCDEEGQLHGSFDVPGMAPGGENQADCTGCTMHVSF